MRFYSMCMSIAINSFIIKIPTIVIDDSDEDSDGTAQEDNLIFLSFQNIFTRSNTFEKFEEKLVF